MELGLDLKLRSWSWNWSWNLRSWNWSWSWNLRSWSWSWSWYSGDLPELELELELKPPELELELIFWRLAGVGVGVGVETSGVGVDIMELTPTLILTATEYISWELRLWATGSRPGRLVTWSYIIRLTPRSRWFPRLVPLPESLEPHDHRIRPAPQSPPVRTWAVSSNKLKVRAIKYEAYFDPNFSNICSQRYRW